MTKPPSALAGTGCGPPIFFLADFEGKFQPLRQTWGTQLSSQVVTPDFEPRFFYPSHPGQRDPANNHCWSSATSQKGGDLLKWEGGNPRNFFWGNFLLGEFSAGFLRGI